MAIYSIKDLEKLSGIKAHTLRVWEQRYGIIAPERTPTNIRYYDDDDLRHVLNIALLNKNGMKISKIAELSPEEIQKKVAALSDINYEYATQLDALTLSVIEMDEFKFGRIVNAHIEQMGFEKAMLEVIYPFLDKLSFLWLTGSITPVQESFMTNLIRQKIIAATERLPSGNCKDAKLFLIYTPEGERQELSLLFMHFLVKSRKHRSVYAGQDISMSDLSDAQKILKPDYIFTMITESYANAALQPYISNLQRNFPHTHLLISGYQVVAQHIESSDKTTVLRTLAETIDFINQLASERSNGKPSYPSR